MCVKFELTFNRIMNRKLFCQNDGFRRLITHQCYPSLCTSKFYVNKNMSKNTCVCGTNHETTTPLVITITACGTTEQNTVSNRHKSKGSGHTTVDSSSTKHKHKNQKNASGMAVIEKKDSEVAIDHLLYSDDVKEIKKESKVNDKPVERSTMFKESDIMSHGRSNIDNTSSTKRKPDIREPSILKIQSNQSKLEAQEPSIIKVDKKDSKNKKEKIEKNDKKERGVGNPPKTSSAVQASKSKSNANSTFPPENAAKLPVLLPRYHGKGCAMEVDILEKHDKHCSYKKQKNPERIVGDDRSGSYEIIGRLVFKTCQQANKPDNETPTIDPDPLNKPQIGGNDSAYTTIYSLFNMPLLANTPADVHLTSSKSDRDLEALKTYIKRKRVFESLAKSSKSFPTDLHESSAESVRCDHCEQAQVLLGRCTSLTSYDVEELYIFQKKSNKAVQISETSFNKQKQKKWFYFLLPCLYSDESLSSLLLYSEEQNID